ncbi:MAG: SurA N-terminal domain-containing protein, partial [Verrucomicrobiaceae bacterium]
MLEFLRRHHKTFWLVVTAVVIIAFTFFGSFTKTGNRGGRTADETAIAIYGREYSYAEIGRLQRCYRVASGLMLPGSDRYYASDLVSIDNQFRKQEDGRPLDMAGAPLDFAVNLLVLREELEKNGIRASDAEVKARFHELPVFKTEGQFDAAKAEGFESNLGSFGMNVSDVYDLLRDWIGYQKLQKLVSGNMVSTPDFTNQYYSATRQTIKVSSIPFALDTFKKDVQVSDDEIKKYFDQKKDTYKTPEQRAASYVFFENPKELDKLSADDRMKENNKFGEKVNNFAMESIVEGSNFDELAKKFAVEVKNVPAFSFSEMPEDIKKKMELVFEIFRNDPKTHPVSDAVKAEGGYYFFKVTEIKLPQQQELKDVQGKIKETLVAQKAQEAMMKAANDA